MKEQKIRSKKCKKKRMLTTAIEWDKCLKCGKFNFKVKVLILSSSKQRI